MTTEQVQEALGVSRDTVERWRRAGYLKAVRVGKARNAPVRYIAASVQQFAADPPCTPDGRVMTGGGR